MFWLERRGGYFWTSIPAFHRCGVSWDCATCFGATMHLSPLGKTSAEKIVTFPRVAWNGLGRRSLWSWTPGRWWSPIVGHLAAWQVGGEFSDRSPIKERPTACVST